MVGMVGSAFHQRPSWSTHLGRYKDMSWLAVTRHDSHPSQDLGNMCKGARYLLAGLRCRLRRRGITPILAFFRSIYIAAVTMISTRIPTRASLASTVARTGMFRDSTHSSHAMLYRSSVGHIAQPDRPQTEFLGLVGSGLLQIAVDLCKDALCLLIRRILWQFVSYQAAR